MLLHLRKEACLRDGDDVKTERGCSEDAGLQFREVKVMAARGAKVMAVFESTPPLREREKDREREVFKMVSQSQDPRARRPTKSPRVARQRLQSALGNNLSALLRRDYEYIYSYDTPTHGGSSRATRRQSECPRGRVPGGGPARQ